MLLGLVVCISFGGSCTDEEAEKQAAEDALFSGYCDSLVRVEEICTEDECVNPPECNIVSNSCRTERICGECREFADQPGVCQRPSGLIQSCGGC